MNTSCPVTLAVIAKRPLAGRVKTRLCPPLRPEQAAAVAAAALDDTLDAVRGADATHRVVVLDGAPWPALDDFTVVPQHGAGLDDRLAHAFDDAAAATGLPVLLVGMDTPQVTPGLLDEAAALLLREGTDAVLGPAADGGWWALGLRRPDAALLRGVPMSTGETGAAQLARLRAHGLAVTLLPVLRDVDTAADLLGVAALAPGTRTARLAHDLADRLAPAGASA